MRFCDGTEDPFLGIIRHPMTDMEARPVLIVEDDVTMRHALESMLHLGGYAAVGVRSANDALTYLATGTAPRLILLDLGLPDLQGEAFYATIREDETLANVPVIVFTGQTDPPSLPGVFATILKVDSPDALMARVDAACRSQALGSVNAVPGRS
jgi:DNA-binding response OmpR family regulator